MIRSIQRGEYWVYRFILINSCESSFVFLFLIVVFVFSFVFFFLFAPETPFINIFLFLIEFFGPVDETVRRLVLSCPPRTH